MKLEKFPIFFERAAMEVVRVSSTFAPSLHMKATIFGRTQFIKPLILNPKFKSLPNPTSPSSIIPKPISRSKLFTTLSSSPASTEPLDPPEPEIESEGEKFDWYSEWYPVMPVCDLDKRVPHAKKVMGIDVVVWWDRNENEWKVFDDACPHRLAPLSEGRIGQWGRLQCVYHGWCFSGSGDCNFIPQAPRDGPPVHTFKKACAVAYPSTLQNEIVWFWPNSDPQHKDIILKKKPPYLPELDDPSYSKQMGSRDFPYGYEVLIENLMDPAHVPYAHTGVLRFQKPKKKVDREGGRPLDLEVMKLDASGFIGKLEWGSSKFIAPFIYYTSSDPIFDEGFKFVSSSQTTKAPLSLRPKMIFFCVPISPGNCRLIWAFPRNDDVWIDKIVPRWIVHVAQNLFLDSDTHLLHLEERKIMDVGSTNWNKACFVPTKSDAFVVGFRKWLNKYAGGQVDWRGKFSGVLPPTPPREQLMDRYWSHVVNCKSCKAANKALKVLEVVLQVISVAFIGIVAATKESFMSTAARTRMVALAVVCFAASRFLAHFIYKNFHYHDYNHALL